MRTVVCLLAWAALVVPAVVVGQDAEKPASRWASSFAEFDRQDQANPPKAGGVLFLGSSSIRLWKLKDAFPEVDALNRGFGGSQIADSVENFDHLVTRYAPRVVVFYAGDNDIAAGKSPEQVAKDFNAFVALLHQHVPQAKLVFLPIKPSLKRWNLIAEGRAANALIQETCERDPLVEYIDLEKPMLGAEGTPRPELFAKDGLHLSPAGYAVWNDLVRPYLVDPAGPKEAQVLPAGEVPTDARLRPQRTLSDAYHPWTPATSKEEWEQQADAIRTQILVSNGLWPLPEKTALTPVIHSRRDQGDYTIEQVYFASRPGLYVTGQLYRPKKIDGQIPGILCPHGHWANGRFYDAGDKAAAEQLASGAEAFTAGAHSPLQARMVQLARMGCTVFHYDMIGYADQPGLAHRTDFNDLGATQWLHSKMGLQTWNSIRALDFVASLPEVDPQRLAVTGASGGGTQTFILCAIDPRPAVSFPAVMVSTAMQGGCNCENADYLRIGLNNVAFAALFAPKPMAMSGADDWTIDIETKGLPELKQVYGLYGAADMVQARCYPQFKHNYNQVAREMMFEWMKQHLKLPADTPTKQSDFELLSISDLSVFDESHPKPSDVMNAESLRAALEEQSRQQLESLKSHADYQEVIGAAATVMLGGTVPAANDVETEERDSTVVDGVTRVKGVLTRGSNGAQIPALALIRDDLFKGEAVLLIDGRGKQALFDPTGGHAPGIDDLLQAGYAVVGVDVFQTGEFLKAPSDYSAKVDERDPAYTFGYNLPLISQRVQDVLTTIVALQQRDGVKQVHLVGTGEGGLWVALARSLLSADFDGATNVNLAGFQFSNLSGLQDPNLLPGALKYGDVPGLLSLAATGNVTVFGAAGDGWSAAQQRYQKAGGQLTVHSESSSLEEQLQSLLKR